MTDEIDEVTARMMRIFMPETLQKREAAVLSSTRFVHYTSASALTSILRGQAVWLRNTRAMNDVTEINFGIDRLVRGLGRRSTVPAAQLFWSIVSDLDSSLPDKIISHYDGWIDALRMDTYILCLSEHDDREDEIGRLSMWRAYGGRNPIALVINPAPLHAHSDALSTYAFPVLYCASEEQICPFQDLVDRMKNEASFLKQQTADTIGDHVSEFLQSYSLCSKHIGFAEEREWRIVHQPRQFPNERVTSRLVEVNSVPQVIYEVPLRNVPDENLLGLNINELVNRIIIGPTSFPLVMYDYFVRLLAELGVEDAHKRVFISHIPLRT